MALLDPQAGTIVCANRGGGGERALLLAHELGHEAVHRLTAGYDMSVAAGRAGTAAVRLTDYGPRERRELEAEVFAREFALPRDEARRMHIAGGLTAASIVASTGLPRGVVERQLLDSLLLPDVEAPSPAPKTSPGLDRSQEAAVSHTGGPLLLSAGPGTGKTRTMVARILHLVRAGVDPASILVLTFSERAAAEASERICAALPDDGARVWVGTFHQFGADIVRRHADRLGLPDRPVLVDSASAVEALEDLLATLDLKHYRNLWSPERLLKDVLGAVSRAKDEVVGPQRYAELAAAMRHAAAGNPEKLTAAERAEEVARVYAAYQGKLQATGGIDYGDMIMLPTLLLEDDPALAAGLRERHRHVLVDEYQDVNRASIRLLKALVGRGDELWAVGDARQAIYRFRGASSASMSRFGDDFGPHVALGLDTNYRSSTEVVRGFVGFASSMVASVGSVPLDLTARRGAAGHSPSLTVCPDDDAELAEVVACVKELAERGVRHGQQAVLCRANARVEKVTAALETAGIPVLHIGNLLEREEVRDLLSLLSLAVDPTGAGLPRVGALPRYDLTLQDVCTLASALRLGDRAALEALPDLAVLPGLSPQGAAGLAQLRDDLAGLGPFSTPWEFLTAYVMDRTRWLADLAEAEGIASSMRRLAVWRLLETVRTQPPGEAGPPIRRFMQRLRRIALLGEAKGLGDVPEAARGLDAVHVMTVHGSKGLEFEAVHLPGLTDKSFPMPEKRQTCPPPHGLIEAAGPQSPAEYAAAEEECLFFVALSRAKTHLRLYQSDRTAGNRALSPSPFLARIVPAPLVKRGSPALPSSPAAERTISVSWPAGGAKLQAHQLEQLQRCPRRMLHTALLGIGAARQTGPFAKTHDCMQRLLNRIAEKNSDLGGSGLARLEQAFEAIWLEHGPWDHGYAKQYRALASKLLAALHRQLKGRTSMQSAAVVVYQAGIQVLVHAEDAWTVAGERILRRIRTGSGGIDDLNIGFALLMLAAQAEGDGRGRAEVVSLTDDTVHPVDLTSRKLKNRLQTLQELGDLLRHGSFPATGKAEDCPRCPHWFACGRLPAGNLVMTGR
ncbi:ImmA/IrrE family metallo-endopeptidase [Roseomonas sp. M0104]|uniref:DNA 3'-5' helicase n=1 Tax=Teichococcus coralli TaxID=2545983 RepID=A0A845BDI1_9PROT|nr:ATP-dependent helicase [Pseudoroseomonas coralli]MXP65643.1 ImmA/IrrE family metallo-endopeptidase [Pseudoroseomonas coralli]